MKLNWMTMLLVAGVLGSNLFGQQYPQRGGSYQSDPFGNGQGVYAPEPPPPPRYAYSRPPMPGPGFYWVDGYWSFAGPRYVWVNGYWGRPPYSGSYWIAPRYNSGRYFLGYWVGGRSNFNRGYGNSYRAPVQGYRPGQGFRGHRR